MRAAGDYGRQASSETRVAWRRPAAALLIGGAVFLAATTVFVAEYAGARGAFVPSSVSDGGPGEVPVTEPGAAPTPKHTHKVAAIGGRAVCVRLCDGFFFPSVMSSGGDEVCASQCPDAPTALYYEPSDRIEDAVSAHGQSYSALPVANRHQASFDETCTCHRSLARSYVADLRRDRTLRNGDILMTSNGFAVFRNGKSSPVSQGGFVALSQAAGVSKSARADLVAMEHAGEWDRQFGAWSSSPPPDATAAPPRPRKGVVTVDDGDPAR